jgi:hypothetical protein
MLTHIKRSILEEIRDDLSWEEAWLGPDRGLITCWETGRLKANESPEISARAKAGELVQLPWEGGLHKSLKEGTVKYGTLNYLAMWQGLRGEDLDIEISKTYTLTCTIFKKEVIFDVSSYLKNN